MAPDLPPLLATSISLDLELSPRDNHLQSLAAVRAADGQACVAKGKQHWASALVQLDAFCATDGKWAALLVGHNIIDFDLPHLRALQPGLHLLSMPVIDTLRLNPLAFPRNPYHHLVKHYQDGRIVRGCINDPELDARLTLELLADQYRALALLREGRPQLLLAWHWLTSSMGGNAGQGFDALFASLRQAPCPSMTAAAKAILACMNEITCHTHAEALLQTLLQPENLASHAWPLAYVLAWLGTCGNGSVNSVMPPWVSYHFPLAPRLLHSLRDTRCNNPACTWCRQRHDPVKELTHWFGFPAFRPHPADIEGRPLQQMIVDAAMQGQHVLGILPTGTGKSLCYQVPALSRFDKTGALTVVVSPLVALMADQVSSLEAKGIACCISINGMLSMPERADALDKVRLGDIGILIISPEQLRSKSVRKVLAQREIGAWVLDEAHCLSKWGHDFRPDYRYIGRFIKERAGNAPVPPVLCLTATAKPDVVLEMLAYFRERVGIELLTFDGGAERKNLDFVVVPTSPAEKLAHIAQLLEADLQPAPSRDGAIVYCASRKKTEEVAQFLRQKGWEAEHFHAGLQPERKKTTQQRFICGDLRVIAATNAFGMGIDKPDVRLVIHADMPGSLENYLQEAGRAGRDQSEARCVLMYTQEDVEWQFGMSARSRLGKAEISAILKSLRTLDQKNRKHGGKGQERGVVVATSGEMLVEETDSRFQRDSATDDTRVRTALAWLEEAHLLTREENSVQVFPSSLQVASLQDAQQKLDRANLFDDYRRQLLALVRTLMQAEPADGISTDELMLAAGMSSDQVRAAMHDLEQLGIASNDTGITAFVHAGVAHSSQHRLQQAVALETALITQLREAAPDLCKGEHSNLNLRIASHSLKENGHPDALPERLWRIIYGLAQDGRNDDGREVAPGKGRSSSSGLGSLRLKRIDGENVQLTLQREWSALEKTACLRRDAAQILLAHWLSCLPSGSQGVDLLAQTTDGQLHAALDADLELKSRVHNPAKLLGRALLWLHELEIIRLNKGLAVFRPAMTIHLEQDGGPRRGFLNADFAPLQLHYQQQVVQIHVMAEYVQRGLQHMADAVKLALEYFALEREEFMRRWLPGREAELTRQTTPSSWHSIVEALGNREQQRIVSDERENGNVLVLAGPGSGKTRVLVHRIAYLVRVKRENPHGILALAYNRHAAVEIRSRLQHLIGDDARGVLVMTCHALAMRLVGASFAGKRLQQSPQSKGSGGQADAPDPFTQILREAAALLKGADLPDDEADAQRARLLGPFRWLLVDEYQDIGPEHYDLIAALAGRTLQDKEQRLNLFAVGDDDQNIYAFNHASVEYIRRFGTDYAAKAVYLVENYRSSGHIIAAANSVIAPASERMKVAHPVVPDRARSKHAPGGEWARRDPVAKGRVQILPVGTDAASQAHAVMAELQRLAGLDPHWNWNRVAVIARHWKTLQPVRAWCELHHLAMQMADDGGIPVWRLRETQQLLVWLRQQQLIKSETVAQWLSEPDTANLANLTNLPDSANSTNSPDRVHLAHANTIDAQQTVEPGGLLRSGRWWDLLRAAVADYALETTGQELPVAHFIDWLAEWGREVRQRQNGLLLTTAHRAKGLEFDHVAVLDGGWQAEAYDPRAQTKDDANAQRRLLYVAMTRARHTLLLARTPAGHALLDQVVGIKASGLTSAAAQAQDANSPWCIRASTMLPAPDPRLQRQYLRLDLSGVDLGFAGRHGPAHPIHRALAALQVDMPLTLRQNAAKWELLDVQGNVVGKLAASFALPPSMTCIEARVFAVVVWRREDSDAPYQTMLQCDAWEVLLPELVLMPGNPATG